MSACYQCAAPILPDARYCGACGVPLQVPRCEGCGALMPPAARFCGQCGLAAPPELPSGAPGAAGEELRTVTVIFALVDGLPLLLEERDPEAVKDLLDDVLRLVTAAIQAQGGVVDKIMADSVMGLFGAPSAREDDAARAVAAALSMVRAVEAFGRQLFDAEGLRLGLKVGINTGKVVSGFVGGGESRAFTVLGEAVNVASRLEHAAPPGAILVADATRRLLGERFRLRAWPALRVKGRSTPVVVHQVLSEADAEGTAVAPPPSVGLVGRAAELDALLGLWREVETERQVRWVTVFGEMGLGKRRLLDELLRIVSAQTPAPRVIRLRGMPSAGGEDADLMGVLVDAVAAARSGDGDNAEWARLVDQAHAGAAQRREAQREGHRGGRIPAARLLQRFDALIHLVADLAAEGPVLIAVEALQDADDVTLDFIEDLAADLPRCPVLIVGLARPELRLGRRPHWGKGSRRHRAIEVAPLTAPETRLLLSRLLGAGQDVPLAWAERMHAFTGGNPVYIVETVRSLVEQRAAGGAGADPDFPIPESIEAVIQSRIDRLGFEEGLTLRAAAVVGDVFWKDALAAVLGSDRGLSLERLARARYIQRLPSPGIPGQEAWAFTHRLLAQVAYHNLLSRVRRRYHLSAASWLRARLGEEPGPYRALIARHLEQAGEEAAAARAFVGAGAAALEEFRFGEVVALTDRARGCLERAAEPASELRIGVARLRGDALRGLGRLREARQELILAAELLRAAADAPGEAQARVRAGWVALLAGEYDAVEADLAAAEAAADEALAPLALVDRLHLAAELCLFRGRVAPVAPLLTQAEALARRHRDERALAAILNTWGKYHDRLAALPEARRAFGTAVELREGLGDVPGLAASLNNLGSVLEALGDLPGAELCHTRSLAVRRRLEDQWGVGATLLNQASVLQRRGYLGRALRRLERGRTAFEAHGSAWGVALAEGELGRLRLFAGDLLGARIVLEAARARAEEMGAATAIAEQTCRLGAVALKEGDLPEARRELDRALELAVGAGDQEIEARVMLSRAELSLAEGDPSAARDAIEELEWNASLAHNAWNQVRLALLMGEIALSEGQHRRAGLRIEEARARAVEHDFWPLVWLASEAAVRAEGPLAEAGGTALRRARDVLGELYARVEAPALLAALRTTGPVARLTAGLRR